MEKDPAIFEKEAHSLLAIDKPGEAYALFKKAGDIYKAKGSHKEAALCLASAAGCWGIKSGEKAFQNSALAYETAAEEAELAGDLEYASLLYRQAAINFERDMEFFNFSDCIYRSREASRRFLFCSLVMPGKIHRIGLSGVDSEKAYGPTKRLCLYASLTASGLVWGYGEKPVRTFYAALTIIFLSALMFTQLHLAIGTDLFKPTLGQSLYFSVITFTTVGYGDITPVGPARLIAMVEVFCGMFTVPLFIVGLSRKYLRT